MNKIFQILIVAMILQVPAKAQWKIIDTIGNANYYNIHFWDSQNGIIGGELKGRFLKTNNGGATWDTIISPIVKDHDLLSYMQFVNDKWGFACGGSGFTSVKTMLIGTKDAGLTWDSLSFNTPGALEFRKLYFKYDDVIGIQGIVFDYYDAMFITFDTGKTLRRIPMPDTNFSIFDAILVSNKIVLTGGNHVGPTNSIYTSIDLGYTWKTVLTDSITASTLGTWNNYVFAAGEYGYIFRSTDGGNTWTKNKAIDSSEAIKTIKIYPDGRVYLLGTYHLYGSDNYGLTWHKSSQVDTPFNGLWDVSMPSKDTGYIISNRRIYKTTLGGGMALSVANIFPVNDEIKVYPNPTNRFMHIDVLNGIKVKAVTIYDMAGRVIYQINSGWQQIDVSGFTKGVYIIEINTDKYVSKKKLLIQ